MFAALADLDDNFDVNDEVTVSKDKKKKTQKKKKAQPTEDTTIEKTDAKQDTDAKTVEIADNQTKQKKSWANMDEEESAIFPKIEDKKEKEEDKKETTKEEKKEKTKQDKEWTIGKREKRVQKKIKQEENKSENKEKSHSNKFRPDCFFYETCQQPAAEKTNGHYWGYCDNCYQTKKSDQACQTEGCGNPCLLQKRNIGQFHKKCDSCRRVVVHL